MRALVTGAGGFIGSKLCARLIRDGHTVRGLVRKPSQAEELRKQGVDATIGDLLAPDTLHAATQGIDTVFHFAAVFRKEVPRGEILATNVVGIENLLEAAKPSGVERFIHCSSTSVYGLFPRNPTTENSPFVPIRGDLYQESKLAAEERVNACGSEGSLGVTIFPYDRRLRPRRLALPEAVQGDRPAALRDDRPGHGAVLHDSHRRFVGRHPELRGTARRGQQRLSLDGKQSDIAERYRANHRGSGRSPRAKVPRAGNAGVLRWLAHGVGSEAPWHQSAVVPPPGELLPYHAWVRQFEGQARAWFQAEVRPGRGCEADPWTGTGAGSSYRGGPALRFVG